MREISTEKIKIGEHVLIDGVEYVAEEGQSCDLCTRPEGNSVLCGLCPIEGRLAKVKKEPKYRPYSDTDEMIADWKERFKKNWSKTSMPLIWVMNSSGFKYLITAYLRMYVKSGSDYFSMSALFDDYTYLDGSPCGKEVTE